MSRNPKYSATKSTVESTTNKQDDWSCTLRQLPADKQQDAANYALKQNPVNGTGVGLLAASMMMGDGVITPAKICVYVQKYWGSEGANLTVSFMEQASAALKDKILKYMNRWWEEGVNFKFSHATGGNAGDIRITLRGGGYWSYLGTDVRQIPKNQATMSLHGFSVSTSDAEYERVVTHETFHTMGGPHEHMRQEIIQRLDFERTISYFMQTQGWSRQDVIAQVLTPLEEDSVYHTAHAEEDSCMTYQLPASITKDGKPIRGGKGITANDAAFARKVYPRPTVTEPEEPSEPGLALPEPLILLVDGAKRWNLINTSGNGVEQMEIYGAKKVTVKGFRMVKA